MNFEEWLESKGHIDGYRTDYQSAYDEGFDEGVKTQQAKIDQLNKKNSEEKRILHNVIEMNQSKIDELQARIDEALRFYNEAKSPHNIGMIQMAIYLKGNKDETGLN